MLGMGLRWLCRRPTARTQERHVGDCVARGGVGDCVGATVVSAAVERRRSSRHDVGGRDVIIHAFFVCVKIVCDVVPRVGCWLDRPREHPTVRWFWHHHRFRF